jgi:hypothetical protein
VTVYLNVPIGLFFLVIFYSDINTSNKCGKFALQQGHRWDADRLLRSKLYQHPGHILAEQHPMLIGFAS